MNNTQNNKRNTTHLNDNNTDIINFKAQHFLDTQVFHKLFPLLDKYFGAFGVTISLLVFIDKNITAGIITIVFSYN
mgnify:CR=1 FL=1